eukprot:jgi/Picsp_1/4530/NSC_06751-R1_hypothetical protein PTSG_09898 [Salpingoeca sp. ATCC 50818]
MDYVKFCGNRFRRFASGHAPLPANLKYDFNQTLDIVTLLRNPVDRIISGFLHNFHDCNMYSMATNYSWLFPGISPKDVKAGRTSPNYTALFSEEHQEDLKNLYQFYWNCVRGCAARMILGQGCGNNGGGNSVSVHDIETAIERIKRFAFIGLNNQWERSMRLWQCMFGGEYSKHIMMNTRPSAHSLLKDTLYKLTRRLKLRDEADSILYLYVESQFALREQKYCDISDNRGSDAQAYA